MDLASITPAEISHFVKTYDLRGKTALFLGGLDEPKRIPFLLHSAAMASALDPDFRLLIAGNGSERATVEEACRTNPAVHYLGSVFGTEKALALRGAEVIAMPGRVGLVAVDSFAAGTPIVTTNWPWHAPEFEYLEAARNAIVTRDDEATYASELVKILNDASRLSGLAAECLEARERYSIQLMVENFVAGVRHFSEAGTR
ncbi:glycosyltransferase family 4 protein [Cryobacterium sp. Y82]|uniref:glycosyltransferase family 4 protein n=1 Tax=Cryobacterium sp. Y82 TaxID=2045017 RepID=UPI001E4B4699|nr:glycosyltransferase family 4 protein [Cryobacterium sp. Y82]